MKSIVTTQEEYDKLRVRDRFTWSCSRCHSFCVGYKFSETVPAEGICYRCQEDLSRNDD